MIEQLTPAAKEKMNEPVFSLAASLPETRVRASAFSAAPRISPWQLVSSTSPPACKYFYDQTVADRPVGLDYASNRYYSSTWGRFLSPDPFSGSMNPSYPQTFNRYAYAANDPANWNDPSGLDYSFGCFVTELPGLSGQYQICPDFAGGMLGTGMGSPWGWLMYIAYSGLSSIRPVDTALNQQEKGLLNTRLAGFSNSNCAKAFNSVIEGYSTRDLVATASSNSTNFYNPRTTPDGNFTQDQVAGNGNFTPLSASLPYGVDANTISGANGSAILLGPNFFSNTSPGYQQNTLLHELLHAYTGWSDQEVFTNFKDYGLKNNGDGTIDITDWLKNDCSKTDAALPPGW